MRSHVRSFVAQITRCEGGREVVINDRHNPLLTQPVREIKVCTPYTR